MHQDTIYWGPFCCQRTPWTDADENREEAREFLREIQPQQRERLLRIAMLAGLVVIFARLGSVLLLPGDIPTSISTDSQRTWRVIYSEHPAVANTYIQRNSPRESLLAVSRHDLGRQIRQCMMHIAEEHGPDVHAEQDTISSEVDFDAFTDEVNFWERLSAITIYEQNGRLSVIPAAPRDA